jgi:hypothetical protein
MSNSKSSSVWLPEPTIPDESHADRDEHTLDWLARCTNWKAVACRHFLNENLSLLPTSVQTAIRDAPRHRWTSTFFELIVARVLQELGASIEVEIPNSSGKRPDFTAKFSDATIRVHLD